MDAITARRELESKSATALAPVLTAQEVTDILTLAEVTDINLVAPVATGYVPTYTIASVNRAAAEAWRRKAGKAANQFTLSGGSGKALNRSDIIAHCLTMADRFASGGRSGIGSIGMVSSTAIAGGEVL